jgi:hypothetical protein
MVNRFAIYHEVFLFDKGGEALVEALVVELTGAARLYRAASSDRRERG